MVRRGRPALPGHGLDQLRQRGIRILPGGDYGFAWTPHGTNAKDLEYFVKYVGMSSMEALLSATAWGAPMMKLGQQLGYIREGCLADILLVDGDPLANLNILREPKRLLAVMKDGVFAKALQRAAAGVYGGYTAPTAANAWGHAA